MTTSQSRDSRGGGGGRPGTRRFTGRRRRQCVCKEVGTVGYKDVSVLRRFISDRGRIESGRKSGNCAKCQRELSTAISRARFMALLPYAPNHVRVTGSIAPASAPAASEDDTASEESSESETPEQKVDAVEETTEEAATDESDVTSDSVESSEEETSAEETDDSPAEESDEVAKPADESDSEAGDESEEEEKE